MIDSTGTGAFANGKAAQILTQVPGRGGDISPNGRVPGQQKRSLQKRAENVNRDYPVKVAIPAGTQCNGSFGGQSNVCLLKIANANAAGPFGGVVAFQIADKAAAGKAAAAPSGTTSASGTAAALPANACVCTCIPSAASALTSST